MQHALSPSSRDGTGLLSVVLQRLASLYPIAASSASAFSPNSRYGTGLLSIVLQRVKADVLWPVAEAQLLAMPQLGLSRCAVPDEPAEGGCGLLCHRISIIIQQLHQQRHEAMLCQNELKLILLIACCLG